MAQKKNTAQLVRELIEPTVNELGYRIWDVEYGKIGTERHLEITIDSDDGINIEDCERVHRAIDPIIDEADPIEEFYHLDVSSPGVERSIRTEEHYEKCVGETVSFKLFASLDGKKNIIGTLLAFDREADIATVKERSGKEYSIERKLISKANIYFEM